MRGVGHAVARLPAAKAILAGAAIIAGSVVSAAQARGPESGNGSTQEQTALAIPRMELPGGNGSIAMPQPLGPSDVILVRRIFAVQARGNLSLADQTIAELDNRLLVGHVLAERYLGRFHRSTVAELVDWLDRYAGQPDAPAVYSLLLSKLPKGAAPPVASPVPPQSAASRAEAPEPDIDADAYAVLRRPALEHALAAQVQRGAPRTALRLIEATKGLSPTYAALLRGEVVRELFTRNEDAAALHITREVLHEAPEDQDIGLTSYVGGLAAWRLGLVWQARSLFATAAEAPEASSRQRAAAAYWRARVARRLHDAADAAQWLQRAAQEHATLHGLIARRRLGLPTGIVPSGEMLSQADVDAIAATDAGWRAFALLQVGQTDRAAAELHGLWPSVKDDPALRRSLLLVTVGVGLTDCAAQLVAATEGLDGQLHDELQFALPRLRPAGGFRVDPALVYALARLESNFNPDAISAAGARGLMQIMPVTAQYLGIDLSLSGANLRDPALNLQLGQRYVNYLSQQGGIGTDLIRMLASYNAGPGSFARWSNAVNDANDPLLFIEAIPNSETRAFVEHALTYTWIYAARLHVAAPSLDEMAADRFPRFTPLTDGGKITTVMARLH